MPAPIETTFAVTTDDASALIVSDGALLVTSPYVVIDGEPTRFDLTALMPHEREALAAAILAVRS